MNYLETYAYKTIAKPTVEVLYKDRKSKFFGYAFPISSEDDVSTYLKMVHQKYPTANHACYAWQVGVESIRYRTNDDGEPKNSAGKPIYGQIQAFGLTNVLVVVVRIFGGSKLGVGGLIQAYKTSAEMALEASNIIEKFIEEKFVLDFKYPEMNKVMRILKQNDAKIIDQQMQMDCSIKISIRKSESKKLMALFEQMHQVSITVID